MAKKTSPKKVLTAGQRKLASLGIELPLLPTTTVGSFPKQAELKEMKYRVQKGFQKEEDLLRKEKMAVEYWVREQEKMNFDVLVDGELNRGDMVSYFAKKIHGFEPGGFIRCYGNRYYRKPIIRGKLEWKEPLIVEQWREVQRTTHRPLKAVLTGPYTLLDWSFMEYYSSREAALHDLTKVIRKEVVALSEAGAKVIQFDDSAISCRPEEFPLISEAFRKITEGIKAYFILHHSYGDLTSVWGKMQRLPIDNFDLETTNSNFSVLKLFKKLPSKKDITIGVIESHRHTVESVKQITDRLKIALRTIPAKQLWVAPDCGLKTRAFEETRKKLQAFQAAVTKVRTSLN